MKFSTAGVACRNGRYFIAKRGPGSAISGFWEFPGGKVEEGETPEEALVREYREEFSVDISVGSRIFASHFNNGETRYRLEAYEVFLRDEPTLTEHTDYKWVPPEGLSGYEFPPSDRPIVRRLMEPV